MSNPLQKNGINGLLGCDLLANKMLKKKSEGEKNSQGSEQMFMKSECALSGNEQLNIKKPTSRALCVNKNNIASLAKLQKMGVSTFKEPSRGGKKINFVLGRKLTNLNSLVFKKRDKQ